MATRDLRQQHTAVRTTDEHADVYPAEHAVDARVDEGDEVVVHEHEIRDDVAVREPRQLVDTTWDLPPTILTWLFRAARWALIALGLLMVVAIAFLLLPTNEDNVIVSNAIEWAQTTAGPFVDVFDVDDAERELIYNLGLAALVYFVLASVVGKLPTGRRGTAA